MVAAVVAAAIVLLPRSAPQESVEVRVDTLYYERIAPVSVVAAPRREVVVESRVDTVRLRDSIYIFADTIGGQWRAEVSGQNVELRSLEILNRVERHSYQPAAAAAQSPNWEVALKSGLSGQSMWLGVGVTRSVGRLRLSLDCGYDSWRREPYVGASAAFTLWRE